MHLHVTSDFIQMINKYYFIYYRRVDIFFYCVHYNCQTGISHYIVVLFKASYCNYG